MRVLHLGNVIRGRALTSNHVSFPKRTNTAFRISMTATRHNSSTPEPVKVTPWSQHPLKSSTSFRNESSPPLNIKKNEKHRAYIALGSNLGDRIGWIEKACNEMSARGIRITRTSNLWETEPMYVLDQEQFVNGACEVSEIDQSFDSFYTSAKYGTWKLGFDPRRESQFLKLGCSTFSHIKI